MTKILVEKSVLEEFHAVGRWVDALESSDPAIQQSVIDNAKSIAADRFKSEDSDSSKEFALARSIVVMDCQERYQKVSKVILPKLAPQDAESQMDSTTSSKGSMIECDQLLLAKVGAHVGTKLKKIYRDESNRMLEDLKAHLPAPSTPKVDMEKLLADAVEETRMRVLKNLKLPKIVMPKIDLKSKL